MASSVHAAQHPGCRERELWRCDVAASRLQASASTSGWPTDAADVARRAYAARYVSVVARACWRALPKLAGMRSEAT